MSEHAIPFQVFRNRMYLTDEQIDERPELAAFIAKHRPFFERSEVGLMWWFLPDEPSEGSGRTLADATKKAPTP